MSETSRRRFIGVSGAGAAAVAAAALVPAAAVVSAKLRGSSATTPVVAHIADVNSDALSLMLEEREVIVHDRDLVIRILNAAAGR